MKPIVSFTFITFAVFVVLIRADDTDSATMHTVRCAANCYKQMKCFSLYVHGAPSASLACLMTSIIDQ